MTNIVIDHVKAFALCAKTPDGPKSSLAPMHQRNALLISITTKDGVTGWGEAWCNFPPGGALSRLNLLQDVIIPELIGTTFKTYDAFRPAFENKYQRMMIHTGEAGPFLNCFAAIDTALADIASQIANLPLAKFLSEDTSSRINVYASTPNPADIKTTIEKIITDGHNGVKLKIGYDLKTDHECLRNVHEVAKDRLDIMVDANQSWSLEEAIEAGKVLADIPIAFLEEPLLANQPYSDWARLTESCAIPLAAGENIISQQAFHDFAKKGRVKFLQPDLAKWGGVSGTLAVGRNAYEVGAKCAIHYMGSALGLAASTHVLSAINKNAPMELDINPNPLRTELGELDLTVINGQIDIPDGNGIGFAPNPGALKRFSTATFELS